MLYIGGLSTKIDYRSQSTIYIGGLSTVKNKYLFLEMVFIHGKDACLRESVRTRDKWLIMKNEKIKNKSWLVIGKMTVTRIRLRHM